MKEGGLSMKQADDATKADQKEQVKLEDLSVEDAGQNEIKGGIRGYYEYHVVATGEGFTG